MTIPLLFIADDTEVLFNLPTVKLVYALSEPPAAGSISILCYSNLELITAAKGLSEQCRDWENPVIAGFDLSKNNSFRTVYIGWDNNKNNRGRTSQPIMPWS